jgi:hypothetical protein
MGIKKAEVPNVDYKHANRNLKDIQEFIDSGWDSAEVDLDGRKANNVGISMRAAIRRNGIEGVKVMKRGGRVFLKRVSA